MKPQLLTLRLVSIFLVIVLVAACNTSSAQPTATPIPVQPTPTPALVDPKDLIGEWQFIAADKAPLQRFVFFQDGVFIEFLRLVGTDTWRAGQYHVENNQIRLDYRDKTSEIFDISVASKQLKLSDQEEGELVFQYIGPPSDVDRPPE